jgi:hypothetical protein
MCTLPLPLSSGEAPNCTAIEVEQFDPNLPLQPPSVKVKGRMLSESSHLSSSRRIPKGSLLSQLELRLVDSDDGEWSSPAWT